MNPDNAAMDAILAKALTRPYVGPFPSFARPSADECRAVKAALEKLHGPIARVGVPKADELLSSLVKTEGVYNDSGQEYSGVGRTLVMPGVADIAGAHGQHSSISEKVEQAGIIRTPEMQPNKRPFSIIEGASGVKCGSSLDWEGQIADHPDQQESLVVNGKPEPADDGLGLSSKVKGEQEDLGLGPGHLIASGCQKIGGSFTEGHSNQDFVSLLPGVQSRRMSLRSHRRNGHPGLSESSSKPPADISSEAQQKSTLGKLLGKKRKLRAGVDLAAPITPDQVEKATYRNRTSSKSHSPQKLELVLSDPQDPQSPLTPTLMPSKEIQSTLLKSNAVGTSAPAGLKASYSGHRSVLDSLVRTILSQNTTDKNSHRAFASLKEAFPTWEDVHAAGQGPLATSIKCGGLAEIKARRILDILDSLHASHGALELEHLRYMSDEQVKAELGRFKGVGPKTVACVLMFCLERHEFPVDTHVWRISKRLGWVPANADREATYEHLNQRVPDDVKYDLHCLLVGHGKKCPGCAKGGRPQRAPDGPCPLGPWIKGTGK